MRWKWPNYFAMISFKKLKIQYWKNEQRKVLSEQTSDLKVQRNPESFQETGQTQNRI